MKLILARNQSPRFQAFYAELRAKSPTPFEYVGYQQLLFYFDSGAPQPIVVRDVVSSRALTDYDGVYINGYLEAYELAVTVAVACGRAGIAYVNSELHDAPSLSKLSMYAKLVAAGVSLPHTLGGTKRALLAATTDELARIGFPAVLKRADADRGIDNYKVSQAGEIADLLAGHDDDSLWVLQAYVENDGYYLVSYYDSAPAFCIFRSLETRPDGDETKAHMYKPKGGANARLIEVADAPQSMVGTCTQAMQAMSRQIGSVDCIYDTATNQSYVLEVNYNPQLVTIETFRDVRIDAFIKNLPNIS